MRRAEEGSAAVGGGRRKQGIVMLMHSARPPVVFAPSEEKSSEPPDFGLAHKPKPQPGWWVQRKGPSKESARRALHPCNSRRQICASWPLFSSSRNRRTGSLVEDSASTGTTMRTTVSLSQQLVPASGLGGKRLQPARSGGAYGCRPSGPWPRLQSRQITTSGQAAPSLRASPHPRGSCWGSSPI